jgi:hypothetical protein
MDPVSNPVSNVESIIPVELLPVLAEVPAPVVEPLPAPVVEPLPAPVVEPFYESLEPIEKVSESSMITPFLEPIIEDMVFVQPLHINRPTRSMKGMKFT